MVPPTAPINKAPPSQTCGPNAYKAKVVTLQVFASPRLMDTWRRNFPNLRKEDAGQQLMLKVRKNYETGQKKLNRDWISRMLK